MLTAADLLDRSSYLGCSELGAIAGLDEYRTAGDVWMEKTGQPIERTDSEAAYFGNLLEDLVAKEYARRNDVDIARVNVPFIHRSMPFFRGHIDRRVLKNYEGLEIKTINAFSGAKLEQPLDKHALQCHGYMAVTGWKRWNIAYLIGGQKYAQFAIDRDEEMIEMIEDSVSQFWRYVESNVMPPIDHTHTKVLGLLSRLYPGTNGQTVTLDSDIEHWHRTRQESLDLAKRYSAAADAAKAHILEAMGEAAVGILPDGTRYTRKMITRKAYEVAEAIYMDFRYSAKPAKNEASA